MRSEELIGKSNKDNNTAEALDQAIEQLLAGKPINEILEGLPEGIDLTEIGGLLTTAQKIIQIGNVPYSSEASERGLQQLLKSSCRR